MIEVMMAFIGWACGAASAFLILYDELNARKCDAARDRRELGRLRSEAERLRRAIDVHELP